MDNEEKKMLLNEIEVMLQGLMEEAESESAEEVKDLHEVLQVLSAKIQQTLNVVSIIKTRHETSRNSIGGSFQ